MGHGAGMEAGAEPFPDAVGRPYPDSVEPLRKAPTHQRWGGFQASGSNGNSLRQQGIWTPPFPFPPPGESRGGRVPPTPTARCAASKRRWHASCAGSPHKRAAAPLWIPCERGTQGLATCETPADLGTITRSPSADICRGVYTKYLTLPHGRQRPYLCGDRSDGNNGSPGRPNLEQ